MQIYVKRFVSDLRQVGGFLRVFIEVRVAYIFNILYCVQFLFYIYLLVFVLCYICPMLQESLDFPFLISPSVFSMVCCQHMVHILYMLRSCSFALTSNTRLLCS